jgi:hypothetical protein
VFWVGLLSVVFGPVLVMNMLQDRDTYYVNADAFQQITPFYRFAPDDPALREDYINQYYLDCFPLGYKGLYYSYTRLTGDPRPLSKALPYGLLAALLVIAGLAAYRIGGWPAAAVTVALILSSGIFFDRMQGGLPRAFGFPVAALALLGLVWDRWKIGLAAVILGALFYPAMGFFSGICLGLWLVFKTLFYQQFTRRVLLGRAGILLGAALAGAVLLVPVMRQSGGYGEVLTQADLAEFPELGPEGRYSTADRAFPLQDAPGHLLSRLREVLVGRGLRSPFHEVFGAGGVIAVLALLGLAGAEGARRGFLIQRPPWVWSLGIFGGAMVVGLILSAMFAPYLYLPYRYIQYPGSLLMLFLFVSAFQGLNPWFQKVLPERWPRAVRANLTPPLVAGGIVLACVGSLGDLDRRGTWSARYQRDLLEFLREETPPGAVVAGWPEGIIETVPYHTRRPALLTYEVHQVFHRDYVLELRERMTRLIDAIMQGEARALRELREEYKVRYLILPKPGRGTEKERVPYYFAPFETRITELRRSRAPDEPVFLIRELVEENPHTVIFEQYDYQVVDLDRLQAAL